jgi:hypothetical protein
MTDETPSPDLPMSPLFIPSDLLTRGGRGATPVGTTSHHGASLDREQHWTYVHSQGDLALDHML